jgi:hypothetical protein
MVFVDARVALQKKMDSSSGIIARFIASSVKAHIVKAVKAHIVKAEVPS